MASEKLSQIEVIMSSRTIDNLGVDVSSRYAQDQKKYDKKLIKEARGIAPQTTIDVTVPSFSSELDTLLDSEKKNQPWAEFEIPMRYNEQKKRLFTHQIIPSLGTPDKKESQAQKIISKLQAHVTRLRAEEDKEETKDPKKKFASEKEEKELEKQKTVLIKLLDCILHLEKNISFINGRRTQYQKG